MLIGCLDWAHPIQEQMSSLVGIIWDVGGGGSQYPFERDLPAPLSLYPVLFSGMVCLYFSRGSRMAALIVMLMALSPPLAWARKIQRKFIPWMVTYHGVGGWGGTELTLSLHPGQTSYKL